MARFSTLSRSIHSALFAATLMLWLGGCSAPKGSTTPTPGVEAPAAVLPVRDVDVFDGHSGARVTWDRLVISAASAEAVLVGENHGHPLGLAAAATLFSDTLDRANNTALAMEFFERDQQLGLDDYLTGLADEAAFRQRTRRTDSSYPPGHRAMVERAREANVPVIAANAPRPYVRLARTQGYDRLRAMTPEQQRMFRIPDALPEGRYRADFNAVMGANTADPSTVSGLDAVFRSQSLWDWTMAESVATAIGRGRAPVFLVIGRFHTDFYGGTPIALRLLRPGVRITTVSFVDAPSNVLRDEDRGRADFVIYVGGR